MLSGTQQSFIGSTGAQKKNPFPVSGPVSTQWCGEVGVGVGKGSGGKDGEEVGKRGREEAGKEAGKEGMGRWIDIRMAGAKRILILLTGCDNTSFMGSGDLIKWYLPH